MSARLFAFFLGIILLVSAVVAQSSSSSVSSSSAVGSSSVIANSSSSIGSSAVSSSSSVVVNGSSSGASSSSSVGLSSSVDNDNIYVDCTTVLQKSETRFYIWETSTNQYSVSTDINGQATATVAPVIYFQRSYTYYFDLQNITSTFAITPVDPSTTSGFATSPSVSGNNGTLTFVANFGAANTIGQIYYAALTGTGSANMGNKMFVADQGLCPESSTGELIFLPGQSGFAVKASWMVTCVAVILAFISIL